MKVVKICALLVLTLGAMRASSWAVAWVLTRLVAARIRTVAFVSNAAAFSVFILLLFVSLLPGEPIDAAALVFGAAVFTVFSVTDLYWRPWKPRL